MITKKLTCYAAKDGHSVFCMVGASGTIVRDNIPSHEAINMIDEMHDNIDSLARERDALKEALTDLYNACQRDGLWEQIPTNIEQNARALLDKLEAK